MMKKLFTFFLPIALLGGLLLASPSLAQTEPDTVEWASDDTLYNEDTYEYDESEELTIDDEYEAEDIDIGSIFFSYVERDTVPLSQAELRDRYDTSAVVTRDFSEGKLTEFRNMRDFNYGNSPETNSSFWDYVKWQIAQFIRYLFSNNTTAKPIKWVFYLLSGAILIYLIVRLSGMEINTIFYRPSSQVVQYSQEEQALSAETLEDRIAAAIAEKRFPDAVRLMYLRILKVLAEKQLIRWRPEKTNREYLRELSNTPFAAQWKQLTYYFDYTRYGHFEVGEPEFQLLLSTYRDMDVAIRK